jgi:hypothetical protein
MSSEVAAPKSSPSLAAAGRDGTEAATRRRGDPHSKARSGSVTNRVDHPRPVHNPDEKCSLRLASCGTPSAGGTETLSKKTIED